jgi:hypothetical protein
MCGVTAALGSGELALMLSYAAARKMLPPEVRRVSAKTKQIHPLPLPPLPLMAGVPSVRSLASPSAANNDTSAIATPPSSDRIVTLDSLFARRLLHAAVRLKRLWARTLLRIYSLQLEFEDRNLSPRAVAINPDPCVGGGPYLFVHLNQNCLLESAARPLPWLDLEPLSSRLSS